jgi:hypothetical protein
MGKAYRLASQRQRGEEGLEKKLKARKAGE